MKVFSNTFFQIGVCKCACHCKVKANFMCKACGNDTKKNKYHSELMIKRLEK